MSTTPETTLWRETVDAIPEEVEIYQQASLADYIDQAREYVASCIEEGCADGSMLDLYGIAKDLSEILPYYMEDNGPMEGVWVQGNGMCLVEEVKKATEAKPAATNNTTHTITLLDGTRGVIGEYDGFCVCLLPHYEDVKAGTKNPELYPTLCLELTDCIEFSGSKALPKTTTKVTSIPFLDQDLNFTRA